MLLFRKLTFLALFFLWLVPVPSLANGIILPKKAGTFSIAPARQEMTIRAGESRVVYLHLANNLGFDQNFSLITKMVVAEKSGYRGFTYPPQGTVDSFSPLIQVDSSNRLVSQGEELVIPVRVSIPSQMPTQSLSGLVILELTPSQKNNSESALLKTEAGVFFLIRVAGSGVESGQLERFGLLNSSRWLFSGQKPNFQVAYKNNGNVHLNPYGAISLQYFNRPYSSSFLDPWFVLPQSIRWRGVSFPSLWWPGYYQAKLQLNLGYDNKIISDQVSFWVIPSWWQILIVIFGFIFSLRLIFNSRLND